eukprot:12780628-Alexandrium_andersonii.AAC.1
MGAWHKRAAGGAVLPDLLGDLLGGRLPQRARQRRLVPRGAQDHPAVARGMEFRARSHDRLLERPHQQLTARQDIQERSWRHHPGRPQEDRRRLRGDE